jgi:hypothetical protein
VQPPETANPLFGVETKISVRYANSFASASTERGSESLGPHAARRSDASLLLDNGFMPARARYDLYQCAAFSLPRCRWG